MISCFLGLFSAGAAQKEAKPARIWSQHSLSWFSSRTFKWQQIAFLSPPAFIFGTKFESNHFHRWSIDEPSLAFANVRRQPLNRDWPQIHRRCSAGYIWRCAFRIQSKLSYSFHLMNIKYQLYPPPAKLAPLCTLESCLLLNDWR